MHSYLDVFAVPSLEGLKELQAAAVGVHLHLNLARGWSLVGLHACASQHASHHTTQVTRAELFITAWPVFAGPSKPK